MGDLINIVVRHERRIRLLFAGPLSVGAYSSTSYYAVTNIDGLGPDPNVSGAIAVANDPNVVELALTYDLAKGARYTVAVTSVPRPAGTYSGSVSFQFADNLKSINEEASRASSRIDELLYNNDLVWNGIDYVEDANGDLARMSGTNNLMQACNLRISSAGLSWDPNYGVRIYDYVDGASGELPNLTTIVKSQLLSDNRIKAVQVNVNFDNTSSNTGSSGAPGRTAFGQTNSDEAYIDIVVTPVGGGSIPMNPIKVPSN